MCLINEYIVLAEERIRSVALCTFDIEKKVEKILLKYKIQEASKRTTEKATLLRILYFYIGTSFAW